MSRRNQSSRRRSYGRRQHEVRERRVEERPSSEFGGAGEFELDTDWTAPDLIDERGSYDSFRGLTR
jgi:hypothetical protein